MKLILLLFFLIQVQAYKTIIDVLSEDAKFSTLIRHLQYTRLIPMINTLETGTFFAPDNSAFESYQGPAITKDVLLYHLLPQLYITDDLQDGQILETSFVRPGFLGTNSTGQMIKITEKFSSFYKVNGARVKHKDVFVNQKTKINVIDRVLEPPAMLRKFLKKKKPSFFFLCLCIM